LKIVTEECKYLYLLDWRTIILYLGRLVQGKENDWAFLVRNLALSIIILLCGKKRERQ
jgi:hypothetical protein